MQTGFNWFWIDPCGGSSEHGNTFSGSIKAMTFYSSNDYVTGQTTGKQGFDSFMASGFSLLRSTQKALATTNFSTQRVLGALSLGTVRPGCETHHSPLFNAVYKYMEL
jgi:hypothetical protein